jgi:phage pi2 protein 07
VRPDNQTKRIRTKGIKSLESGRMIPELKLEDVGAFHYLADTTHRWSNNYLHTRGFNSIKKLPLLRNFKAHHLTLQ